ncbi:unnamed protein product, partial [Brassica rapa]
IQIKKPESNVLKKRKKGTLETIGSRSTQSEDSGKKLDESNSFMFEERKTINRSNMHPILGSISEGLNKEG